jgi:hypothetical protein
MGKETEILWCYVVLNENGAISQEPLSQSSSLSKALASHSFF